MTRFYLGDNGPEISSGGALLAVRPLDAVADSNKETLSAIIRAWTAPPGADFVPTHWEQVMAAGRVPVDLSAEPAGLVPRRLARLFHKPGTRGEVWRPLNAASLTPRAAELLARWAARYYAGYDISGAILSADLAARALGKLGIKPRRAAIWCSQSVFLFCRSLGPDVDPAPGYDADRDGVDPAELHGMIKQRPGWIRVLRWE